MLSWLCDVICDYDKVSTVSVLNYCNVHLDRDGVIDVRLDCVDCVDVRLRIKTHGFTDLLNCCDPVGLF